MQRGREIRRVTADQQGAGDAGKQRHQRLDPALLRHAAGDPDQPVVADQRALGGVGVGGLAVVDEGDAVDGDDALLAMRQSGIAEQAGRDRRIRGPRNRAMAVAAAAFWALCAPGSAAIRSGQRAQMSSPRHA